MRIDALGVGHKLVQLAEESTENLIQLREQHAMYQHDRIARNRDDQKLNHEKYEKEALGRYCQLFSSNDIVLIIYPDYLNNLWIY